ncbi:hypothetical protein HU750_13595 [Pseudomonas sp. SWRI50]|uniref:hypothetical protein n=1 Tax=Pseudomonas sp. SWRI50 TaxID=2745484 RepID=UPI001645C5D4|nr:hypothetical protein [Pseudomonas sp. SWRI50]MBC3486707.1 hypothetical protein [Pseudomonas sp. SWRI50]
MSIINPKYEPISLNNQNIPKLLQLMKLDGPIIEVPKFKELLPIGICYWNVDTMVRRYGGVAVYGWEISIWKKSHINAMHHAIWRSPSGDLFDVTETYSTTQTRTHSTFVHDESIIINLEQAPHVPSKVMPIKNNSRTREYAATLKALHACDKKIADTMFNIGYRCENQFGMAQGRSPSIGGQTLAAIIQAQAVLDPLIRQRQAAFERHSKSISTLVATC